MSNAQMSPSCSLPFFLKTQKAQLHKDLVAEDLKFKVLHHRLGVKDWACEGSERHSSIWENGTPIVLTTELSLSPVFVSHSDIHEILLLLAHLKNILRVFL
jgi:hypothetical protein